MDCMVKIGSIVEKSTVEYLAEFIERTFKSSKENNMDQRTVRVALRLFKDTFGVENVTVTNSKFIHKGNNNNEIKEDL